MAVTVDAELERHYNAGAAIPDPMDIFARRAECGAARDCRLDIAYGGARETMDIFPAAGSTPPNIARCDSLCAVLAGRPVGRH